MACYSLSYDFFMFSYVHGYSVCFCLDVKLYIKNTKAKGTGNGTPGSLEIKARKIVMSQIKARTE